MFKECKDKLEENLQLHRQLNSKLQVIVGPEGPVTPPQWIVEMFGHMKQEMAVAAHRIGTLGLGLDVILQHLPEDVLEEIKEDYSTKLAGVNGKLQEAIKKREEESSNLIKPSDNGSGRIVIP